MDYLDLIYAKKQGGQISCMCTFNVCAGTLAVFGGAGSEAATSSFELLNETATGWQTQQLQHGRYHHAMVLLPCP